MLGFAIDFIKSENGQKCQKDNARILKKFIPTSEGKEYMLAARTKCENYCSDQIECWGCSIFCESNCTWNAVEDCKLVETVNGEVENRITQKPGNIISETK